MKKGQKLFSVRLQRFEKSFAIAQTIVIKKK